MRWTMAGRPGRRASALDRRWQAHEQLGYQSQCRGLGQRQRHQSVLLRSHREFSQPAHSDHPNTRKLEESMTRVHCDLSMLLDGFITGPDEGMEKPLRDDAGRLHDWMCDARAGADAEVLDELYARTGAILMGRRMFDVGVEPWGDPPPFHMPVSVLTHEARDPIPRQGGTTYTFVTDGSEAGLERARGAAGKKDVGIWGGANIVRQYPRAGLLDEMQIHLVPVLLGYGVRLFEDLGLGQTELERTRTIETPKTTHLRFIITKRAR